MMRRALIRGRGITALTCAKLLALHGWDTELYGSTSQLPPPLVLKEVTCDLLRDIWGADEDLFAGSCRLKERIVCWDTEAVTTVPQPAVAIRSQLLVERLQERLMGEHGGHVCVNAPSGDANSQVRSLVVTEERELGDTREMVWLIDASGRSSGLAAEMGQGRRHRYGHRCVIGTEVGLASELRACLIEAVPGGWVFMAPLARDRALLQAMVPAPAERPEGTLGDMLNRTRYIRPHVTDTEYPALVYDAAAQITEPLCGEGWVAVGEAAISFDPICGDGVGYAARGAILAAAVLEGIASGLPEGDCLQHYQRLLQKTFGRHVRECLKYYSTGFSARAWKTELELMRSAGQAIGPDETGDLQFGLLGFRLVRLSSFSH